MPQSLNIFGREIPLYGLLCILGIISAIIIAYLLSKRKKIDFFDFSLVSIFTLLGAWLGSKLLFLIVYFNDVIIIFSTYSFDISFKSFMSGGYVFYGGLIGGTLSLLITLKVQKLNIEEFVSIFAIVLPLGHAFGRIGCFISGCCYGIPYDGIFSYTYTQAMDITTPLNTPLLPIQLIESFLLFIIFIIMLLVYLKTNNSLPTIIIYIFSYPTLRFVLEFFRGDYSRGIFAGLSTSQWISLIIIFTTSIILIVKHFKNIKTHN